MATHSSDLPLLPMLLSRKTSPSGSAQYLNPLIYPALYRGYKTGPSSSSSSSSSNSIHGSIFNLEFSPTDSIVVAACSNNALVGYDPRIVTSKPIRSVLNAHCDCTNCITFTDEVTFATCSDDKTIRLWDLRNLSSPVCTLVGHTNWIKNIEYDRKSRKLFSVAFQDGVRQWHLEDIKDSTYEKTSNLVFRLDDPLRMRIAPDGSKMFVSMRRNRCFVIDQFDGDTITEQREMVEQLLSNSKIFPVQIRSHSCQPKANKLYVFSMSGLRGGESYRSVMSVAFHPSSEMVALRHFDVKHNHLEQELSTLYDLRISPDSVDCSSCSLAINQSASNYLKYTDEFSPDGSLDFIKECSFSPDGRVLASPHYNGARLLAVDSNCTPFQCYYDDRFFSYERDSQCYDFDVVCELTGHSGPVLACGFAHHDMILGTGCMEGEIRFHKPEL